MLRKKPEKFVTQTLDSVSAPDQKLFQAHPELLDAILRDWLEAFRSGVGGTHQESAIYRHPWGFRLKDITAEVHLWHGENDNNVPVEVARYVADTIPKCHATFVANEGHFSVMYKNVREILGVLLA